MSFNEKHIELFRTYIEGQLSVSEKEAFEKRLSTDLSFKSLFDEFLEFETTLRNVDVVEVYDQVGHWEANHQKRTKRVPIRRLWLAVTGVAAAAAILLFMFLPGSISNDELVDMYFEPYDNVITVRGKKETLDNALLAYDMGQYQDALELFNKYPNDSIGMFYRAESLMALKRYEEAAATYDDVIANNGVFVEVSKFHKALALIGAGKKNEAKVALKQIPKGSHYFGKAKDLLDRL